jgi:transcriptional regulator with XRE-family HTH domain
MAPTEDFPLVKLRKQLGLIQPEMARRMGLSLRPYQELESRTRKIRLRHILLAQFVALDVAIEKQDAELAPAAVREKAAALVQLMLVQNIRRKASVIARIILDEE